ncbi:hypothetical protein A6E15_18210 [Natrinema saccharevitans]|uniref:Uncharacterized protein n=1 Tax=Natrinema saccharevitans TaxID=301967 RepID=A0A1S8ART8_9EURY|nr:hypothetical protein A6E15_18210 [Natrinema saccharevitans]
MSGGVDEWCVAIAVRRGGGLFEYTPQTKCKICRSAIGMARRASSLGVVTGIERFNDVRIDARFFKLAINRLTGEQRNLGRVDRVAAFGLERQRFDNQITFGKIEVPAYLAMFDRLEAGVESWDTCGRFGGEDTCQGCHSAAASNPVEEWLAGMRLLELLETVRVDKQDDDIGNIRIDTDEDILWQPRTHGSAKCSRCRARNAGDTMPVVVRAHKPGANRLCPQISLAIRVNHPRVIYTTMK